MATNYTLGNQFQLVDQGAGASQTWNKSSGTTITVRSGYGDLTGGVAGGGGDNRFEFATSAFSRNAEDRRLILNNMQVRRNDERSVGLDFVQFSDGNSDTGVVSKSLDLSGGYFPVGVWVPIPNIVAGVVHQHGFASISLGSRGAYLNLSVRNVNTSGSEAGAAVTSPVIEVDDAQFTATIPDADLATRFQWNTPGDLITSVRWDWGHTEPISVTSGPASDPAVRGGLHDFPRAGTYNVLFRATSRATGQTVSSTQAIKVPSGAYTAAFNYEVSYLDASVDAGVSVGLARTRGNGSKTVDTVSIDWGDGVIVNGKYIADHTYAGGGDYPVKVTITNDLGQTSSITKTVHIDDIPVPEADFGVQRDFLRASFFPTVTGGTYQWTFGDGTTSTQMSPTKVYSTPGVYNVTMRWTDPQGTVLSVTREVNIVQAYTPISRLTDALRLEIELAPETGLYNFSQNPNGEQGGFAWITPTSTGNLRGFRETFKGIDGWKLVFTNTDAAAQYFRTEYSRCNPGEFANWTLQMFGTGFYRVRIDFFKKDGTFISSGVTSPYYAPGGARTGQTPAQAPADTFYMALRVDHYGNNSGSNPTASQYLIMRRVMFAKASSATAELTSLVYTEGHNWLDIMGDAFHIEIDREELDTGMLSADVRNGDLDPSRFSTVRVGQKVRLRAAAQDLGGNLVYENLATGTLEEAKVSYDRFDVKYQQGDPGRSPDIVATNRATNPRFANDTSSWTLSNATRSTTDLINGAATVALNRSTTTTTCVLTHSARISVVEGDAVSFSFDTRANNASAELKWRLAWYNSAGTFISFASILQATGSAQDRKEMENVIAPSGATTAQVQAYTDSGPACIIYVTRFLIRRNRSAEVDYFDGSTAADADYTYAWTGTAHASESTKTFKEVPATPDTYNAVDDPARTVIEIAASDVGLKMASVGEPRGIYRISDLPFIMEGKGVPWIVNNSSDQLPVAAVVSQNENAKLIDQVAITRDTDQGYAWVNRNGVMCAYDSVQIPKQIQGIYDEDDYSEIEMDYDTDAVINSVTVVWLRTNSEGDTEEIKYGPYEDQDSIDRNGFHPETFTIHGLVESVNNITNFANSILARAKTPKVRCLGFAQQIINAEDIRVGKALLDLYDLVTVKYAHSNYAENLRVAGIKHVIDTDTGWSMAATFKVDGSVPSVQSTPSPPAATVTQQTAPGPLFGGVSAVFAGPYGATNGGAGATTGGQVNVAVEGLVTGLVNLSAFATTTGNHSWNVYIDNVFIGTSTWYFNTINEHQMIRPVPFSKVLTKGTHYFYVTTSDTAAKSDANDSVVISGSITPSS